MLSANFEQILQFTFEQFFAFFCKKEHFLLKTVIFKNALYKYSWNFRANQRVRHFHDGKKPGCP
jgi:hypothetical protein